MKARAGEDPGVVGTVLNIRSDNPAGRDGVLKSLALPDGTDMAYRDAGQGPVLLLVLAFLWVGGALSRGWRNLRSRARS